MATRRTGRHRRSSGRPSGGVGGAEARQLAWNAERLGKQDQPPDDAPISGGKSGRLGRIYDRLLDVLVRIRGGEPAERALEQAFRQARDLGSGERAEISETVYGFIRSWRSTQDLLERAARQDKKRLSLLETPVRTRLELLAYLAGRPAEVDENSTERLIQLDPYAFRRIPGLFERILAGSVPTHARSPVEQIGVEHSLPEWLAERLVADFGEARADALGAALNTRAPLSLRVNLQKTTQAAAQARIFAEHGIEAALTPLAPHGLILPHPAAVATWPIFEEGAIEVQDEGSQLAALALGAAPGERVLDACAGAGGKTLALAQEMRGTGRVVAIDRDSKKLDALRERARRANLSSWEAIEEDFMTFPDRLVGWADRVIVDVPCSGTGRFRRQPDARFRADAAAVHAYSSLQRQLLKRAIDALRPGGWLLYVTCSLLREENDAVVAAVLEDDPRITRAPLVATLGRPLLERCLAAPSVAAVDASDQGPSALRIGPGPTDRDPDGFFVALMQRRSE